MRTTIHPEDIAPVAPGLVRATSVERSGQAFGTLFNPIALNAESSRVTAPVAGDLKSREPFNKAPSTDALSPEEKALCAKLGIEPSRFAETKAALNASSDPQDRAPPQKESPSTERPANAMPAKGDTTTESSTDELSPEEESVCKKLGIDPSKFAAAKAALG